MLSFSPFFLFEWIINKVKSPNSKKKYIQRSSVDLLKNPEYRDIPYEDLWKSATRCKLIYDHHRDHSHPENREYCDDPTHNKIYNLWKFINNIEDTQEIMDIANIDDSYIHELRSVSEPISFQTIHYKHNHISADKKFNTTSYVWHTSNNIYITFHVDKYIEKEFLKQQNKFVTISNCISVNKFFYDEMLIILNPIMNYIETVLEPSKKQFQPQKIIIAGYSLGGVIVQIISAVLSQIYPDIHIACHTFGSPKAGNCAFVKWFNSYVKEHYRIVNGNDPITMFPLGCNWSHISNTTLQFDMDLHINILQKDPPWYRQIWMKPIIIRKIMKQYKHDHDFHIYITRLWKYVRITKYVEMSRKVSEPP